MGSSCSLFRTIPLLSFSGAVLLGLSLLSAEGAKAEECRVDPFGAEVCLPPDPDSLKPPPEPKKPRKPRVPMVFIDCFGPCKEFPPAPPYRQFEEAAAPESEIIPEPAPEPEPEPPIELIKPLWFKSDALDHATAKAYLDRTLRNHYLAQSSKPSTDFNAAPIVEFNGVRYLEVLEPNTALLSGSVNEPGVNTWVRGFGGGTPNAAGKGRYADIDGGGVQVGIDIPLSQESRIGVFGTYASMNGDDGSRGSWDVDGWGGGGYAEYWTDSFYLRGMISAGDYSGEQTRRVDGKKARGDRNGNSWTGVISLGAPFDSGDWILEPQALLSYTNTSLGSFSEHGADRDERLRFHGMEADGVDTELSMKFSHPIRDGERSLFMPSLRIGWVADWGQNGDRQRVTFLESGDKYSYGINGSSDHGALVEVGIDYTTFNFTDTSMGIYASTGAVFWGGDRGTAWQVEGGLNFRF